MIITDLKLADIDRGPLHQIALDQIAPDIAATVIFLYGFNAFGDDDAAQNVGQIDQARYKDPLVQIIGNILTKVSHIEIGIQLYDIINYLIEKRLQIWYG
jgi:hypothetical protein